MPRIHDQAGLSLVELLIAVTLVSLVVGCFYPVWSILNDYHVVNDKQYLIDDARYAMERMAMFVQDTGKITQTGSELRVTERVLDLYDNVTHAYRVGGDGLPDSDHDGNGIIDDGTSADVAEEVRFRLSGTSLLEKLPNYASDDQSDFAAKGRLAIT